MKPDIKKAGYPADRISGATLVKTSWTYSIPKAKGILFATLTYTVIIFTYLIGSIVTLVADTYEGAGSDVRVANHTLSVALLTQPSFIGIKRS